MGKEAASDFTERQAELWPEVEVNWRKEDHPAISSSALFGFLKRK